LYRFISTRHTPSGGASVNECSRLFPALSSPNHGNGRLETGWRKAKEFKIPLAYFGLFNLMEIALLAAFNNCAIASSQEKKIQVKDDLRDMDKLKINKKNFTKGDRCHRLVPHKN
jgi:hypothetical protein